MKAWTFQQGQLSCDLDSKRLDVQEQRGLEFCKKLNLDPIVIKEQGSGLKPYSEVRPKFTELVDKIVDGLKEKFLVCVLPKGFNQRDTSEVVEGLKFKLAINKPVLFNLYNLYNIT